MQSDHHKKTLIISFFHGLNAITFILALGLMNRKIQGESLGLFLLANSFCGIIITFFDFGLSKLIIRRLNSDKCDTFNKSFLQTIYAYNALLILLIFCLSGYVSNFLFDNWLNVDNSFDRFDMKMSLNILLIAFSFNIIFEFVKTNLLAVEKHMTYAVMSFLFGGGFMIILILNLEIFGYENLSNITLVLKILIAFLTVVLLVPFINKFKIYPIIHSLEFSKIINEIKPFIKIGILTVFTKNIDKLILTRILTLEFYAIYEILLQTVSRISVIVAFSNKIAMPKIVQDMKLDTTQLKNNWKALSVYAIFITWPVYTIIYLKSDLLFFDLLGVSEKQLIYDFLPPVLALFFINSLLRVSNTIFISCGNENELVKNQIILFIVLIILLPLFLIIKNVDFLLWTLAFINFFMFIRLSMKFLDGGIKNLKTSIFLISIGLLAQIILIILVLIIRSFLYYNDIYYIMVIGILYLVFMPKVLKLINYNRI